MPAVPGGKQCRGQVLRGLRGVPRDPMPRLRRGAHRREEVLRLVWRAGIPAGIASRASRSVRLSPVLHSQAPCREDPHLEGGDRGRAEDRHCDVLGRLGLHGDVREARSRRRARDHGPRLRGDPGRRSPPRGHDQPVPGRRGDGALRGAHRPRGPRSARAQRGAGDPGGPEAPGRGRQAGPRDRVPHADGDQYRPRRRRRHRPRPPHGLHGSGRYDEPRAWRWRGA